ncbi:hypothetical protein ACFFKU_11250 [Kineococcus gynurae]|uniref:Uncharacterized protein n=1 Tax=Kineococcus gynurae TaxID=452979 RepID=A0ABV5LUI5_9ACTN
MSRVEQWTWTYTDTEGRAVESVPDTGPPTTGGFPSRSDAEVWIGQRWRELRRHGVEHAHLHGDGRPVGPPLSLHPAD